MVFAWVMTLQDGRTRFSLLSWYLLTNRTLWYKRLVRIVKRRPQLVLVAVTRVYALLLKFRVIALSGRLMIRRTFRPHT